MGRYLIAAQVVSRRRRASPEAGSQELEVNRGELLARPNKKNNNP